MKIEYHKWWSPSLEQDMELKVYGYYGKPTLVFPAQGGRFYEFEDFRMVDSVSDYIESGRIKLFTVDSVDQQSWANWSAHPADRAMRHQAYDRYIISEVIPFVDNHCQHSAQKLLATGCSMGGYHSANFFFRYPNLFDTLISISGLFKLDTFIGDYMDETVYLHSPLCYLPNLTDPFYLDLYKKSTIIICAGQGDWEEHMVADIRQLEPMLRANDIPAIIDLWGYDVDHDWPWWRKMLPYFLGQLDLPAYNNR